MPLFSEQVANGSIPASNWKAPVRVVATSNLNVASPGATVDTITLVANDRILLAGQTNGAQNGIYDFHSSTSSLTRSQDFDSSGEAVPGTTIVVTEGTTNNADTVWELKTGGAISLGTTALVFAMVAGPGMGYASSTDLSIEISRATTAEALAAQKAQNLADLASAPAARTNLGLGSAATQASSAFDAAGAATAAQAAAIAASQGAWNPRLVTSGPATAVAWDYVFADTTGGTFVVNAPTPTAGKQWGIKWIAGTVAPTLSGFSTPPPISALNQGMEFIGDGSVWRQTVRPALAQLPDYPAVTDARYTPKDKSQTIPTAGASQTLATDTYSIFDLTLTAAACALTFSGTITPNAVTLIVRQDGTGSRTITWSGVTWITGTAPTLKTAANGIDTIELATTDGTHWIGYADVVSVNGRSGTVTGLAEASALASEITNRINGDTGKLQVSNNLSDVGSVSSARTNLGLGTAAQQDASAFLTSSGAASTYAPLAAPTFSGLVSSGGSMLSTDATKGVVLKDANAHYWRLTVNTNGQLVSTDLGTSPPAS